MAETKMRAESKMVETYMPTVHIEAFKRAAGFFKVWILVRRGNPKSKEWIGMQGYIPKLLDCKAKTADQDFEGLKCAGLVVSPKLVPQAFSTEKLIKAKKEWTGFEEKLYSFDPKNRTAHMEAVRQGKHYTLQLDEKSKHFGCVLYKPIYRAQADYIHADYDLYAIVEQAKPNTNTLVQQKGGGFGGADHSHGPKLMDVQYFTKAAGQTNGVGVPMIRHGEQETFKTDWDEKLDVFAPDGKSIFELDGEEAIKKFYKEDLGGRQQYVNEKSTVLKQVYGSCFKVV